MNTLDASIIVTYGIRMFVVESTTFVATSIFTIDDQHGNNKTLRRIVN